jgi:hypothetical protein
MRIKDLSITISTPYFVTGNRLYEPSINRKTGGAFIYKSKESQEFQDVLHSNIIEFILNNNIDLSFLDKLLEYEVEFDYYCPKSFWRTKDSKLTKFKRIDLTNINKVVEDSFILALNNCFYKTYKSKRLGENVVIDDSMCSSLQARKINNIDDSHFVSAYFKMFYVD